MAYRIEYTTNVKYQPKSAMNWDKLVKLTLLCFLIFLLLTSCFWTEGKLMLQKMIFPGDLDLTAEAFTVMLDQIRGGEALDEAVAAFCREILSTADLSS